MRGCSICATRLRRNNTLPDTMSHFGTSPRTAETERRMAAWRKANPDATTSQYNAMYTRTWESLAHISDKELTSELDRIRIAEAEEWRARVKEEYLAHKEKLRGQEAKLLSGGKRPPRHRRPATKGAFGKKKHQNAKST